MTERNRLNAVYNHLTTLNAINLQRNANACLSSGQPYKCAVTKKNLFSNKHNIQLTETDYRRRRLRRACSKKLNWNHFFTSTQQTGPPTMNIKTKVAFDYDKIHRLKFLAPYILFVSLLSDFGCCFKDCFSFVMLYFHYNCLRLYTAIIFISGL